MRHALTTKSIHRGAAVNGCAAAIALAAAFFATAAFSQSTNSDLVTDAFNINAGSAEDAILEADQIDYDANTEVVRARGDVQVFSGDHVLRANEIVYDSRSETIEAFGEITLTKVDGSVIVADSAEFDSEVRNGLIRGARAVLADGQTRIAAVEARRVDDRYTSFSKAVYSPCEVCKGIGLPLWRIRARRATQDEVAKDITYAHATFDLLGVPVGYLPYFRHADPTVKRRTGFLTPKISQSSVLGNAIKVPYFYAVSPNRDFTITPYLSTGDNPVLELETRAWETYGTYALAGSYTWSHDELQEGARGHVQANGVFFGPRGFSLGYNGLYASDDTYLRRYNYSSADRATIELFARRYGDRGFINIEAVRFQSFRADESAGTLPLVAPHITLEQRAQEPVFGGEIGFAADSVYLRRTYGRAVTRLSGELFWDKVATSDVGFVFDLHGELRGDLYNVEDDAAFDNDFQGRLVPMGSASMRYPLGKATSSAFHLIEPVVQVTGAAYYSNNSEIPNEDSQDVELDDLNIFTLNRFPGRDRIEDGPRAAVGIRYRRTPFVDGPVVEATFGQTFRLRDNENFSEPSGLREEISDIVGSWRLFDGNTYDIGHRLRITDGTNIRRNEVYARIEPFHGLNLSGTYVSLDADSAVGAKQDRAVFHAGGQWSFTNHWSVYGGFRRDLEVDRFVNANSGLRYSDACFEIDFSMQRRFNSVPGAPDSTQFGLIFKLKNGGQPVTQFSLAQLPLEDNIFAP
jgi:LPS-assembly protein